MFPPPFTDIFACVFIASGYCPPRSLHIFHISHQVPVSSHVPCSWGRFQYSKHPALGTLQARAPAGAATTPSFRLAQY